MKTLVLDKEGRILRVENGTKPIDPKIITHRIKHALMRVDEILRRMGAA